MTIADGIDADFPTGLSVALLGRNGAGKSSLLKMIAGTVMPDRGRIERRGSVSWPVGFAGSFHGDLTGAENARFVARIYGIDTDGLVDFVDGFADLGRQLHSPFRTYSSGMRARLGFAISMGVPFDTYLVDEVTAVGDARFKERSETILNDRLQSAGAIVVSHSLQLLDRICDAGAVLENGRLTWHDDVKDAIAHHRENMGLT
ncbi:MAG: ABC transporter ATP-binding protein [Pseudomonadota bacterium]